MDGWGMGRGAVNWKMIEIRVLQIDEQESLIKENKKGKKQTEFLTSIVKICGVKDF